MSRSRWFSPRGLTAALLFFVVVWTCGGVVPAAVHAQPTITESEPSDGDVLPAAPGVIHLCFSEPVDTEAPGWKFDVLSPSGISLGLRIAFEPSGDCVDIFPGTVPGEVDGVWIFDWLVTSQANRDEASGTINFEIDSAPGEGGTPPPTAGDGGDDTLLNVVVVVIAGLVVVAGAASLVLSRRKRNAR